MNEGCVLKDGHSYCCVLTTCWNVHEQYHITATFYNSNMLIERVEIGQSFECISNRDESYDYYYAQ